jgi:hypothetical protein
LNEQTILRVGLVESLDERCELGSIPALEMLHHGSPAVVFIGFRLFHAIMACCSARGGEGMINHE